MKPITKAIAGLAFVLYATAAECGDDYAAGFGDAE